MSDIFVEKPRPNKSDAFYIPLFLLLIIIFYVGYLQYLGTGLSTYQFGSIYFNLSIISFIILLVAVASRNHFFNYVIYGTDYTVRKLFLDFAVGGVIGFLLASGGLGFNLALPLSISTSNTLLSVPLSVTNSTTTNGIIPTASSTVPFILLLVLGFFGVEAEEMFRASTLLPSILQFVPNSGYIPEAFILFGVIILFAGISFIGVTAYYVAIASFILGIITYKFPNIRNRITKGSYEKHIVTILFVAMIFGLLHVFAYGSGSLSFSNLPLFEGAIYFAVMADSINWFLQSTISSRIAHSMNNSLLGATALGLPLFYGWVVAGAYALYIFTLWNLRNGNAETAYAERHFGGQ